MNPAGSFAGRREFAFLFAAYFALIALVLRGAINDGFDGDAIGYLSWATRCFSERPWFPFVSSGDTGHPLLIFWLVGVLWRFLPAHNVCAHAAIWSLGAAALALTHLLARGILAGSSAERLRFPAGPAAALLLFVHPMFLSQTAQYLDAVPILAFTLGLVLAAMREKPVWIALCGIALALTRINGIVTVFAMFCVHLAIRLRNGRAGSVRDLLSFAWPYIASALSLGLYLAVKLLILRLPLMSVGPAQVSWAANLQEAWLGLLVAWKALFNNPRLGLFPWFGLILLAVAAGGAQWFFAKALQWKNRPAGAFSFTPAQRFAYPAFAAIALFNIIFHSVHALWDQPRWYLAFYPFVIIGGLHALGFLTGGRRWAAGIVVLVWAAFQFTQWNMDRAAMVDKKFPRLRQLFPADRLAESNLSVLDRVRCYEKIARAVEARRRADPVILGSYPTPVALSATHPGYVQEPISTDFILDVRTQEDLKARVARHHAARPREVIGLITSWDVDSYQLRELLKQFPGSQKIYELHPYHGHWAEVYILAPGR